MGRVKEVVSYLRMRIPPFSVLCLLVQVAFIVLYGVYGQISSPASENDFPLPQPYAPPSDGAIQPAATYLHQLSLYVFVGLSLQGTYLRR